MGYRLAADALLLFHWCYVLFVVLGQVAILIGWWRGWAWVRRPWFRITHLVMIAIVVGESLLGITCPLTIWESQLRTAAGQTSYSGDFLANAAHNWLFISAPPAAFTVAYTLFGLTVLLAFWRCPPKFGSTSFNADRRN